MSRAYEPDGGGVRATCGTCGGRVSDCPCVTKVDVRKVATDLRKRAAYVRGCRGPQMVVPTLEVLAMCRRVLGEGD